MGPINRLRPARLRAYRHSSARIAMPPIFAGHISQRNQRRRVGPEHIALSTLVSSGEKTEARKYIACSAQLTAQAVGPPLAHPTPPALPATHRGMQRAFELCP